MRIDGAWLPCDGGRIYPVLSGEARAADGSWVEVQFLLDTGADRTVLGVDIWRQLGLPEGTVVVALDKFARAAGVAPKPSDTRPLATRAATQLLEES